MKIDYPRNGDPFAETDIAKLSEYRAWAHRALDTIIDTRLNWEESSRDKNQPYHSFQSDYAESDKTAEEIFATVLMFANRLIGRKALAFNAEMFDESSPKQMRVALLRLAQKISTIWPSRPVLVTDISGRRSINNRDLTTALIELDKGCIPDLFTKGEGRYTDLIKLRCRFAGALWSMHLKARGFSNYTAKVASAFGLGSNGNRTVQRWREELSDLTTYTQKLGYEDVSYVINLIERAKLADTADSVDGFGPSVTFRIFGSSNPSLYTLEGIGWLYQEMKDRIR